MSGYKASAINGHKKDNFNYGCYPKCRLLFSGLLYRGSFVVEGQILVLTYPLVGNYGVPPEENDELGIPRFGG